MNKPNLHIVVPFALLVYSMTTLAPHARVAVSPHAMEGGNVTFHVTVQKQTPYAGHCRTTQHSRLSKPGAMARFWILERTQSVQGGTIPAGAMAKGSPGAEFRVVTITTSIRPVSSDGHKPDNRAVRRLVRFCFATTTLARPNLRCTDKLPAVPGQVIYDHLLSRFCHDVIWDEANFRLPYEPCHHNRTADPPEPPPPERVTGAGGVFPSMA